MIYSQNSSLLEYDKSKVNQVKNIIKEEKGNRLKEEYNTIFDELDHIGKKSLETAKEKGASSWISALPLKSLGFVLNKQEFRDALRLRYCWTIDGIPKYCGCGSINDIVHALACKKGGYVSMRHNALRDGLANMMKDVCKDVQIEPSLMPVEPNNFNNARTTTAEGARLDISARGLISTFECTFFDVRVCHPLAASNVLTPVKDLYVRN